MGIITDFFLRTVYIFTNVKSHSSEHVYLLARKILHFQNEMKTSLKIYLTKSTTITI